MEDKIETKPLYLDDSYQKEFSATILDIILQEDSVYIVLNETLFYPKGGGQPSDLGVFEYENQSYIISEVIKREGRILHKIDAKAFNTNKLKVGTTILGRIDWNRRYKLMRMHTASHVLDTVLYRDGKIMVTGNELGVDKTRIDFNMPEFNMDKVREYVSEANKLIQKNLEVKMYYLSREDAFKIPGIVKLAGTFPPSIPLLRIIEIVGLDIQADGGTHVRSLSEIGKINILTIENKGKERKRVYFELV